MNVAYSVVWLNTRGAPGRDGGGSNTLEEKNNVARHYIEYNPFLKKVMY